MSDKVKIKVISWKNMPSRLPIFPTITTYLFLDRLGAAGWVWGAVGCVFVIGWAIAIIAMSTQTKVDIFESKDSE